MGVGVDADGGDFQFAAERPAVERFDVLEFVDEAQAPRVDFVVSERVEHERIVGIRAVAEADEQGAGG